MTTRAILTIRTLAAATAIALSVASPTAARAQDGGGATCLGFAFGAWTPALDWEAAGHGPRPDQRVLQRAPAGRDWAAESAAGADSVLILYPAWWPAGVLLRLPTRAPALGDTVVGRAVAFVANGRVRPPEARVRAWRVPCSG